ncbi:MAG TPA: RteC domain-containing protein [Puia sp.]|nr:RteC domain-containing protein [Puia sp.]
MTEKWQTLHAKMLAGIERCWHLPLPESGQVFTCYLEYLPMVYLALSYEPDGDVAIRSSFWQEETNKLQKFTEKNRDFVTYYKEGDSRRDLQYFLPENYDLANFIVSKVYDREGESMRSHDHLVATLLAHQMYYEYAEQKIRK